MYERFTDRSRQVMHFAQQEAMRLYHESVAPEHILLGLLKEGSGVAARVLKNLDIHLDTLRRELEKHIVPGPVRVLMGRLPLTPDAKQIVAFALTEAKELGHNYVGTEHLLLGLLRVEDTIALKALAALGINRTQVREEILNLVGPKEKDAKPDITESGTVQRSEYVVNTVIFSQPLTTISYAEDLLREERHAIVRMVQRLKDLYGTSTHAALDMVMRSIVERTPGDTLDNVKNGSKEKK